MIYMLLSPEITANLFMLLHLNVLANSKGKNKVKKQTEFCQHNPSVAKGCLAFSGKQKPKNSFWIETIPKDKYSKYFC